MGYFVAIHLGLYQKHGVDFEYLPGGPDKIADQVLLAGKADIALTNPETTVALIVNERAPFKIIGTQYQKSPLGIVSLAESNIRKPIDLIGKKLAVPAANRITVAAFLKVNNIPIDALQIVPYAYDPSILIDGRCDATVDFVTNIPFVIKTAGRDPNWFLFYDYGLRLFMDTVVVRAELLEKRRDQIIGFLRASREGWQAAIREPRKYIEEFDKTFFKGTGRTIENELAFQREQTPHIEAADGIFGMSEVKIRDCIDSLNAIGLKADRDMFDTSVLAAIK
ncbi:ABC transporter substrate-binding protein [Bradyrhizobium sp. 930_D9_N1_4]|uniref:ABC transporter substrate-binding protein n=1 Tax=Bradyrhizobium sp. 930_D9_N1_4 TaxID=3240374 RepID=UPI003F8C7B6C